MTQVTIDETKLHEYMGRVVSDAAAATSAVLVLVGDRLGLYEAMADGRPVTAAELAQRTGTAERYIREWLFNQAASGNVEYDPASATFALPAEQAFALADKDSPVYLQGMYQVISDVFAMADRITEAFRSGDGIGWHEHTPALFSGTERFFRPGYRAHLVSTWIPAIEGAHARLLEGASVADIGCGHGASTIVMAEAYPASRFTGFDYHAESIDRARAAAQQAGMSDRVRFEVSSASTYPGSGYDLVAFFDCLHDMGDPVGAARHVRQSLDSAGALMVVEPFANDRLEDNLNPLGRMFSAASTCICVPASLSQPVGRALGAQSGETGMRSVLGEAGFTRVRRASETPFNIVYEARP